MLDLTEDQQAKLLALLDNTDDLLRVRFGPRPHQTVPLALAEAMLTLWASRSRSTFGTYLRDATLAELAAQNGGGGR